MEPTQVRPVMVQEAPLTHTASFLRTLFDTAEDAIVLMDGLSFVDCNPAAVRMFACGDKAGLLGKTFVHFSPELQPDGTPSAEKARRLADAAFEGVPQQFEWRHRRLDLTELDVESRLSRFVAGGAPFLLAVVRDITARKRAEEALLREKLFSERLIDSLPGLFYLCDRDLRLRQWNKSGEAMMGYTAEELRGKPIEDFLTDESRPHALEVTRAILEKAGPTVFLELELKRKDGTAIPYLCSGVRIDSPSGPMLLGVGVDISGRVRAERELQSASRAKDQFLAVLSHELRTPLAAIQAGVDLLRCARTAGGPPAANAMDVIDRNVKLQARLVDDLLDLSRLTRGSLTIERAPVPLDDVVLSAVSGCRAEAERAGISLDTSSEPGLWVEADASRLQQVFINLVGNAVKFTPSGGRVSVFVSADGRRGRVVVEDTGVGIEAARLADIFEMFRQGEIAARRAAGLGIGLALVKSIVEMHGGSVWAESPGPGKGSRFIVELPLRAPPSARAEPELAGSGRSPVKMLLVEDNRDTREMLAETLTALRYEVIAVESAEQALDVLAKGFVDVIVADIGLPGMDGYEMMRRARSLPSCARCPAFALTGYGTLEDKRRALSAGYTDHLTKPVDCRELDRRLRSLNAWASP
jgi:PAS domain S-box-containing protein